MRVMGMFTGKALVLAALAASLFVFVSYLRIESGSVPAQVYAPFQTTPLDPITTDTWGIFNSETGEVVMGGNENAVRPIASITKLFTAATILRSDKKDIPFTITAQDIAAEGRAGRLSEGDRYTPYELLFPLLIESSNDAAAAVERTLGDGLNSGVREVIQASGLTHTVVKDASGLSAENVSTVTDLAAFFSYIRKTAPHILDISQLRMYVTDRTEYHNNNPGRTFDSFKGGKHGYTEEAGRTFVGLFRSDTSNEEFGIVLLGSTDLEGDITALHALGNELVLSGILGPNSQVAP